ncbi:hypothetical protein JCM33374_g518 [Metschnikowia sp. JCM 33374]|nr:hypothetical protein JCM33374_g518 [Metschnikowia sp. JCM 33374]
MSYPKSKTPSFLEMTECSLEMKQFREARELSARDNKFREEHQKDWIHGIPSIRSLITYTSLPSSEKISKTESFLVPDLTLSGISSWESTRHSSLDTTSNPDSEPQSKGENAALQSDEFRSPFSGILRVPSFTYTRPDKVKSSIDLSQYVMQSHFEVGEVTYFFGGLQSEPSKALKQLGIPRSTDPSLISVHFPCDMPPFVNKDVLMSPYFLPNPSFFLFNPTRSTVHDYSKPFDDFEPGHFCEMKGTQISEFHVFFCGGFKVNVDTVHFDHDSGRWVVEKSISTNDNGYILDVRKLSFTKVSLISRSELEYHGRVGAAICSNFSSERCRYKNSMLESQSSSSIGFVSGLNSINVNTKDTMSPTSPISPVSPYPPLSSLSPDQPALDARGTSISLSPKSSRSSKSSKSSTSSASSAKLFDTKSLEDSNKSNEIGISADIDPMDKSTRKLSTRTKISETFDHEGQREIITKSSAATELKKLDVKSTRHSDSSQDPKASDTSPATSHRVPAMFAKSGRFFHKSSSRQPSAASSTSSTYSSYSQHVKQHRSKSSLNTHTDSKYTNQVSSSKSSSIACETNELESSELDSSPGTNSRIKLNENSVERLSPPEKANNSTLFVRENNEKLRKQDSIIFDAETQKSDQKAGIKSICVHLFGGFFLVPNSESRQGFKATNDLLKLELILSDNLASEFHPEALIDTVHPQTDLIPAPRGYFAHVMTSNGLPKETCHLTGPGVRAQPFKEYSRVPGNISQIFTNGHSIAETEKQTTNNKSQDNTVLIVHGGVDEKYHVYGDCYYFNFSKESWVPLETYAFDYYGIPKKPYEDEDSSKLQLETQLDNAKLVDAELRSCHHKAAVYWEGDKEYIAFIGGYTNDFLRHYDPVPYESPKFDVSRLAKLSISSVNSNLLRIPVLNIRSQVWKFKRYFYDLSESAKPAFIELLKNNCIKNSRLAISGGGISIVGKQLTFCHGIVQFVPEKAKDYETVQEVLNNSSTLLGGHFHLTFPGM